MDLLEEVLACVLLVLGVLIVAMGGVLIGLLLAGVFDVGPLAAWWAHRCSTR